MTALQMHERQSWLARHGGRPCGRDSPDPVRQQDLAEWQEEEGLRAEAEATAGTAPSPEPVPFSGPPVLSPPASPPGLWGFDVDEDGHWREWSPDSGPTWEELQREDREHRQAELMDAYDAERAAEWTREEQE
eukprot:12372411-Alexandrium_andersonii.AAC.1